MESYEKGKKATPHIGSEAKQPVQEYLLTEYTALRAEILDRSQAQRNLVSFAFVISGTLLTLGVTHIHGQDLYLVVPLFLFFLAVGWGNHDKAIKMLGSYIRDRIEPYAAGINWEGSVQRLDAEEDRTFSGLLLSTHIRGTFLLLELLPLGLAIQKIKFEAHSLVLLVLDMMALFGTWVVLKHRPRVTADLSNNGMQRTAGGRR